MKMFAVITFFTGLFVFMSTNLDKIDSKKSEALALNYLIYRNCVQNYVFEHKLDNNQVIDNTKLNLVKSFKYLSAYKAQIYNDLLFIYCEADRQTFNSISELMYYSKALHYYTEKKSSYPDNIALNSIISVVKL